MRPSARPTRTKRPRLARLLGIFALVYAVICVGMFVAQRSLQYFPNRSPMDPAAAGLPAAQALSLQTADGERLAAWWIAPRDARKPVYLYLHGNGDNLEARTERFAELVQDGSGLFALSWRGYGGSTGTPTETGLRIDSRTAYDELAARVDASRIVLFGESLGSTLAVMLAADVRVGAVLLDSSFDSALAVAQHRFPWLPVAWMLQDTFRADLAAPRVTAPVLQVHCDNDPITPLPAALALNALLPNAEPLLRIPRRCHVVSLRDYDAARLAFVERAFGTD